MRKLNNAGEPVRAIEGRLREKSKSDVEGVGSSFAPKAKTKTRIVLGIEYKFWQLWITYKPYNWNEHM